jgi:chemotaxis protein MotB
MTKQIVPILVAALLLTGCVTRSTYNKEVGMYDTERQLNAQLETEIQADQVKIQRLQDRLKVTVEDEILFPEGGWQLNSRGKAVLDKMLPALQDLKDHRIEVEGYTDNVPIGGHLRHKFPTNWELSAARAAEVAKYLQNKGIDPSLLTAAGHGEYQPVESNDTAQGRQANRRIEVDLVPNYQKQ